MGRVSNAAKKAAAEEAAKKSTKTNAVNMPAIITDRIETQEQELAHGNVRIQHSDARPGEKALDDNIIPEIDTRPVNDEKMAMLAFFNEDVAVRIATTADKNADQVFEITVNGKINLFRRGEKKTVKRYVVDHLARMKQTTYTQQEVVAADGTKSIANIPTTSLKYDFSVEHDPHPRGKDWLRAVLAEA
jgi:hypothetical protein